MARPSYHSRPQRSAGFEFTNHRVRKAQRPPRLVNGGPAQYISEIVIPAKSTNPRFVRQYRAGASQPPLAKHTKATRSTAKVKRSKKANTKAHIANITVMLAMLLTGALGYFALQYKHAATAIQTKPAEEMVAFDSTQNNDSPTPAAVNIKLDESKPKAQPRKVAPHQPARIKIPSLGTDTFVIPLGNDKSGAMDTPKSTWLVGWYDKSSSPSDESGVTVMNGHVFGPSQKGIFYNLKQIKTNDTIEITNGDGTVYTYKVVKTAVYKAGDIGGDLYSAISDKPGLNLVTCTGKVNKAGDGYEDRFVVFAERS